MTFWAGFQPHHDSALDNQLRKWMNRFIFPQFFPDISKAAKMSLTKCMVCSTAHGTVTQSYVIYKPLNANSSNKVLNPFHDLLLCSVLIAHYLVPPYR